MSLADYESGPDSYAARGPQSGITSVNIGLGLGTDSMNDFEQQIAEALVDAMPITEGPALQHRRPLAEILAPRVAAALRGRGPEGAP